MVKDLIGDVRLDHGGGWRQIYPGKGVVEIDKIKKVLISMLGYGNRPSPINNTHTHIFFFLVFLLSYS